MKKEFIHFNHNFHLITDPSKLIVTVKGEAKDTLSSLAGIYIPEVIDATQYWLQDPGTHIIWLKKLGAIGFWAIGTSTSTIIFSPDDPPVDGPEKATSWMTIDFKPVDTILVDIVPGQLPDLSIYEYVLYTLFSEVSLVFKCNEHISTKHARILLYWEREYQQAKLPLNTTSNFLIIDLVGH